MTTKLGFIVWILAVSISCVSKKSSQDDEYAKGSLLLKLKERADSLIWLKEKKFDSLKTANAYKLLFLDFWEGMNEDEYRYAVDRLLKAKVLLADTIPDGYDQQSYQCSKWITENYVLLYGKESSVRCLLYPIYSSDEEKLLISVSLAAAQGYDFHVYYLNGNTDRFCYVHNFAADALLNLYQEKYGRPESYVERDGFRKQQVYSWKQLNMLIIARRSIREFDKDYDKRPVTEYFEVEYWNSKTFDRLGREQADRDKAEIQEKKRTDSLEKRRTLENI